MMILSIEGLAKSYGERVLFADVSFGVEAGDKIGVIGVNGTGKSTFLKVIAGVEPPDSGKLVWMSGAQVEYLPQNPDFEPTATVLEQVFKGHSPVMRVIRDYEEAVAAAEKAPDDETLQKRIIRLGQEMDANNAWQLESEAKSVLTRLGITDFSARVGDLSGGQRKRIALASALINPADLLILDEPTNHIDNDTVAWLEEYLASYRGALLMITHDRYFLDRVSNRTIELDKGRLFAYTGNYSDFLTSKAEREEREASSEQKRQSLLRKELAWIKRGAQARSTKQKARIERFEQLRDQESVMPDEKLTIETGSTRLGRTVIELNEVGQSFEGRTLFEHFSYTLLRNDRAGVIGPNGSGKSTLLNLIAGRLLPDQGSILIGQTVKIGYFSQESVEMDDAMRVIEYVQEEAYHVATASGETISASQMLERFLFPSHLQWTPIGKLSGVEKRRLQLLRILMSAPNVLLLDEPTNDLDIQTLAVLEDYLDSFPGALVVVSHDRYFLDRTVDKVFAFENGMIRQYPGGYSDYDERRRQETDERDKNEKREAPRKSPEREKSAKPLKFTFAEQKEYAEIDAVIAGVEAELRSVGKAINTAGSDYSRLQELTTAQTELEAKLEHLMDRWTYLNELAEKIEQN